MPDNNVPLSAKIANKTMDYHMRWRHVVTCCRAMCAYYAYVTIRRVLGVACFGSHHFVNTVSGQHFSAENKQEAAEFDSQHLPMHFRGVIWKIKSKSNFLASFNLISAEMNLVGNYRMLRGLRTINPEGLRSINVHCASVKCGPRSVHYDHFLLVAWSQQIIDWRTNQNWDGPPNHQP